MEVVTIDGLLDSGYEKLEAMFVKAWKSANRFKSTLLDAGLPLLTVVSTSTTCECAILVGSCYRNCICL